VIATRVEYDVLRESGVPAPYMVWLAAPVLVLIEVAAVMLTLLRGDAP